MVAAKLRKVSVYKTTVPRVKFKTNSAQSSSKTFKSYYLKIYSKYGNFFNTI